MSLASWDSSVAPHRPARFLTPCLAPEDLVQPRSQFYPFLQLPSQPSTCPSLKCTVPSKKVNKFSSLFSLSWPQTGTLMLYYYDASLVKNLSKNRCWFLEAFFHVRKWEKGQTSLMVQWLGLHASTTGDEGSVPGLGTKILHAVWCGQNNNKKSNFH